MLNKIKAFWNNLSNVQQGWAMAAGPTFIVWLIILAIAPKFTLFMTAFLLICLLIVAVCAVIWMLFEIGIDKISRGNRRGR